MMKIIKASKTDIEALANLLAEGFTHDPLYCHYIPYEEERQGILVQIFRKILTDFWEELTVFTTPEKAGVLCICPHFAQGEERVFLPAEVQKVYERICAGTVDQFYQEYLILDLLAVRPEMRGKRAGPRPGGRIPPGGRPPGIARRGGDLRARQRGIL